ncbi:adenosine kinase-like [Euwallacea similis]|uniref:adenosine kinase-like n=1 Tax=Euwallacea similis TaxID=1736056 RepID=UPI00344B1582
MSMRKTLIAFGNPLLDITVTSKQHVLYLLGKYNLKLDGQKEITKTEMTSLTEDIRGYEQYISPGGCSQNSLRVLQWVLKQECQATMFGSVGNDVEANILREALKVAGVQASYITQEDLPTGKIIALVSGFDRFLVAHIGAAEVLPLAILLANSDFMLLFNSSDIILIEAYFLTNRIETACKLGELCQKSSKTLVFNLCGEYIFEVVPQQIKCLVKAANLIFGNRAEFLALAKLFTCANLDDLAEDLQGKTLVVTDGPRVLICYNLNGEKIEIVPPVMQIEEVKDTTGAGDAFMGGFLAGMVKSKALRDCIEIGFYAASCIMKECGCSLPRYKPQIDFDGLIQ